MNTNWTSPKTNIFSAINDLRSCLASGHNARLIRLENEKCSHPIRVKNEHNDFRCYEFNYGTPTSINKIMADTNMSEFSKHLSLNYVSVFGSEEAMNRYYETGVLSDDNLKNMGRSHLVQVDDLIAFLNKTDYKRAEMYRRQYRNVGNGVNDVSHFFDFYRLKRGNDSHSLKQFKHKLWVVEMLSKDEPKAKQPLFTNVLMAVITWVVYPLKFIPKKSVLRMNEYTNYTFRIGDVIHGFSVEFQIPKKFSFK
jgi:hypothetical protein